MTGVNVQESGYVSVIELARPPLNFFDRDALAAIADAGEAAQRSGARVILLCAEGKHFCAGQDLAAAMHDPATTAAELYEQGARILRLALPIVAAVQGAAVGGGLGLACTADFRIASAATRFEANFAKLGFHHGFGLSLTLPAIVGNGRAARMLYSGRAIDGEAAYDWGLVDELAETGHEREVALRFAEDLAATAPLALQAMRRTLRSRLLSQLDAALSNELAEQQRSWSTNDCAIGVQAALTRTTPEFTGA